MLASKASEVLRDVPGREVNLSYYSSDTVKKSKIPTYQSTNGVFTLNQFISGSSAQLVIPPNAGLEKIILALELPATYGGLAAAPSVPNTSNPPAFGTCAYDGLGLPTGWGYNMISNVQFMLSGSALFTMDGETFRAAALANASNSGQKSALMSQLGGSALAGRTTQTDSSDFAVPQNRLAYVVLSLFGLSSQSGTETPCPLPTNLCNGSMNIIIQFADFNSVFASNGGVAVPTKLRTAYVQTRQLFPMESSDALRLSGSEKYLYPMTFYQNEIQIPLAGNSASITGIKEGQCRGLMLAFTPKGLPVGENAAATALAVAEQKISATTFYLPENLTLTYNGVVIHRFPGLTSGQILDTLYTDITSTFETKKFSVSAPVAGTSGGFVETPNDPAAISNYIHCPFAQRFEQFSGMSDMTLMNGISLGAGSIQVAFDALYDVDGNVVDLASQSGAQIRVLPYLVSALEFDAVGNVKYVF